MAIFHYDADIASRKAGQSSIAMSAYRCGESLVDIRTGEVKDFSRKAGVIHAEIAAPEGSPEWVFDRQELWNRVEQSEKRADAQLCRSMIGALPHELSDEERLGLVRDFVTREFTSKGMVVDFQIHAPGKGGDDKNFHVHMMGTTRRLDETTATGFAGKKEAAWRPDFKKGKGFKTALAGGEFLSAERDAWAEACNRAMEAAQIEARISAASLARRGIEREARTHLGPSATAMERRGIKTRLGDRNRAIDAEDGRVQEERRQLEAKAAAAEREAALKSTALDGAEREIQLLARHLENLEASAKAAREQEATARELAEARRANEPKPAPVISSPEALREKQAEQERERWAGNAEVSREVYPYLTSQQQKKWREKVENEAVEPAKSRILADIQEWEAKDDLDRLEHAAAQNAALDPDERKGWARRWPEPLSRLEAQAREAEALREKHQAEDIPAAIQMEREQRRQRELQENLQAVLEKVERVQENVAGWREDLEREKERQRQAEQKQKRAQEVAAEEAKKQQPGPVQTQTAKIGGAGAQDRPNTQARLDQNRATRPARNVEELRAQREQRRKAGNQAARKDRLLYAEKNIQRYEKQIYMAGNGLQEKQAEFGKTYQRLVKDRGNEDLKNKIQGIGQAVEKNVAVLERNMDCRDWHENVLRKEIQDYVRDIESGPEKDHLKTLVENADYYNRAMYAEGQTLKGLINDPEAAVETIEAAEGAIQRVNASYTKAIKSLREDVLANVQGREVGPDQDIGEEAGKFAQAVREQPEFDALRKNVGQYARLSNDLKDQRESLRESTKALKDHANGTNPMPEHVHLRIQANYQQTEQKVAALEKMTANAKSGVAKTAKTVVAGAKNKVDLNQLGKQAASQAFDSAMVAAVGPEYMNVKTAITHAVGLGKATAKGVGW